MQNISDMRLLSFVFAAFMLVFSANAVLAGPKIIRIAATGDIMMGTENFLPEDEAAGAFAELIPFLKDRQLVIGNLEGPLTDRGTPAKAVVEGVSYVFRTPPDYVDRLKEAGFTIMSLANNHANDYGPEGHAQTTEVLDSSGILYTGGIGQWARQRVGQTTVSVLALAPNSGCQDINDIPAAAELVKEEVAKPDTLVIVVFHGGGEGGQHIYVPDGMETFLGENRGELRKLSHDLIDAGAHLIIGHGPHVPRGLEIYNGRLIAYSLGNFVTGKGISISGNNGLAPLLLVDLSADGKLLGGRVVSFKQNTHGVASLDADDTAFKLMHALSLYDFDNPALGPEGLLVTSDSEAKKMAADTLRPARPRATFKVATTAKPAEAPTQIVKAVEDDSKKRKGKNGTLEKKPAKYEWDIYSGSSSSMH